MLDGPVEKTEVEKREEEVLAYWGAHDIFKKSVEKEAPRGEFVFYDGPPFATGLPHYGHILAGTIKDVIPRFRTMQGFRVRRRWGWDCHGLPLENIIEKELGLRTKKDILEMGVERFNAAARSAVLRYASDWKRIVPRLGRWVDMENDYKTMDATYTESVWWSFKTLHDKGLVYQGFKSMHLCPRCETTLSNFEVSQGYKDISDLAITVKFELADELGTVLLAWTTTPWTLPGNTGLAVNPDIMYVKIAVEKGKYILAKDRLSVISGSYTVLDEFKGKVLVGKSYLPVFRYFEKMEISHKENLWKVWGASYVSTETGTGIVHLAPAFGEDDLKLAQEHEIPIIWHVGTDGKFTAAVTDFGGLPVKPIDDHGRTDIEVLKNLAGRGLLFAKEKITHSYPHCWRCDTPLLNFAATSWFVKVLAIKDTLVAQNKKIRWVPGEVGERRFGNWLSGARDWAISRSRFWGAPIPVWRNEKNNSYTVIGSLANLKEKIVISGNRYFVLRHGEAEHNLSNLISSVITNPHHLTVRGKEESQRAAETLEGEHIDTIITSPFPRAKETAAIAAQVLGIPPERIVIDNRLAEANFGIFNLKSAAEYHREFSSPLEKFEKAPHGGETLKEVKRRVASLLYELENRERNKKILLITHEYPAWLLAAASLAATPQETLALKSTAGSFEKTGTLRELSFVPLPHNTDYELDFHRPFIDDIALQDSDGTPLVRVPDVFDCWYESGSMPFGENHYPFEHLDRFNPKPGFLQSPKGFPADFIAEGLDQTRGWFYSLLVLSIALFGRSPYRSVVVNGTILAEDGQKMSKRLKNYPDPMEVVHRYGADALRYYLLSSSTVRGEDLRFSEKGVDEVSKKVIGRLLNVLAFYELYKGDGEVPRGESPNFLDRWILTRLSSVTREVTDAMEAYELDRATRPLGDFIEDLSTWYLRRSRDRMRKAKGNDKAHAVETLRTALCVFTKIIAPAMPFVAEYIYRLLEKGESVHLVSWPVPGFIDETQLRNMEEVRAIVSLGLEERSRAGIKVRQPLLEFRIGKKWIADTEEYASLVRDELNVKHLIFDAALSERDVVLDTTITEELGAEGDVRELLRNIQKLRKSEDLAPSDRVSLYMQTSPEGRKLVDTHMAYILESAGLLEVVYAPVSSEGIHVGVHTYALAIKKSA